MSFDNLKKPRGGKRKNSGRKKGQASIAAEKMREKLAIEIAKEEPKLRKALLDKALGHYQIKEVLGKMEIVYKTAPDIQAIKEAFDRSAGKVKDTLEVENPTQNLAIEKLAESLKKLSEK